MLSPNQFNGAGNEICEFTCLKPKNQSNFFRDADVS